MDALIIALAKYGIYALIIFAAIIWIRQPKADRLQLVLTTTLSGALAFMLAKLASHLWYNPRPFVSDHLTPLLAHANNNGFPSDHTLLGAVIAFSLLTVSRRWGLIALIAAIAVGASRVLAHAHHPVDILGGIIIAGAAVGLATLAAKYTYAKP